MNTRPIGVALLLVLACASCQDQPKTITGSTPILPQRRLICRIREAVAPSDQSTGVKDEVLLDANSALTANTGDAVAVELKRSSGTGYEWRLSKESGPLTPTLKAQFDTDKGTGRTDAGAGGPPGAPVMDIFDFTASAPGTTKLVFELVRPWEADKPGERRVLDVTVVGASGN